MPPRQHYQPPSGHGQGEEIPYSWNLMAAALPGAPQRQQLGVAPQQLPPSIDVASGGRTNVNIPAPPELFQGVQLPGLPFSATEDDIRAFLAPTECVDVLLVNRSGLPSGEAFVVLGGGPAALLSAVSRNKQYLGPWYIEVFAARRGDYYRAAAAEVEREDLKMAAAAATAAASGGSLSLPPPPPLLSGPASPAAVAVSSSSAAAAAAAASSSATLQISPRELREQLQQFAQLQQQQALWMLCGGVGGKQHQMREQEQQQQHFDQGTATIPPPPPQLSESLLALAALPVPPPISSVPFVPVTPPPPTLSTVAALAAVNATSEKARAASVAASARASASAAASPSGLKIIFGSGESLSGCLSSGNGGNNSDAGGSGGGGGSRGKTAATAMATTANAASGTTVLRLRGLPFSADEDDIIAWIAEHCAEKKEKKICSGRGGRNCGSDSGGSNCGSGSDSSPLPHSPLPPTSSASSPKEQQQQQHLSTVRTFIYLLRSREGKSSGQAHVSFESSEAAEVVARACDHAHFGQRYIEVSWSSPIELERARNTGQLRGEQANATAREHQAMLARIDRNLLLALSAGVGGGAKAGAGAQGGPPLPSSAQLLGSRSRSLGSAAVARGSRSALAAAAAAATGSPRPRLSPGRAATLAATTPPGALSPELPVPPLGTLLSAAAAGTGAASAEVAPPLQKPQLPPPP